MLRPLHYTPFTARELKPAGWLKKQLEIQAAGLSGHLDQVWPDIRDSRWIGGDKDGWERVPYWLDGFIPLAWLLEDKDLQVRAKRYIDAILAQQQEDGWICPCSLEERPNYDVWALFLLCKVLVVYEECSQDPRVEEAVYRALRNLHSHIEVHTLFDWAAARWFECLIPIYWLYERRPNDLYCVKRGPLLYAVAIQEEWTRLEYTQNGVERKYPYCDYEIRPLSPWNYAFADDSFTVEEQEGWDAPFSTERPPISLTGTFVQIDWGFDNGLCHEVPDSRVPLTPPQQVRLIPYGCTNLRMTEMPWIQAESPT